MSNLWHPVSVAYQWLHHHVSPEGWSALGTWATVLVAVVAAIFALRQVRELRITRERQAQPNVVAFIRPNAKVYQFLDLVVANYGLTPAYHVKLEFPPLTVSPYQHGVTGERVTELYIPDEIAVLAPGQEWRTMWDAATERYGKRDELGSRFKGFVKFQDSRRNKFKNLAILDWDSHFNTIYVADKPDESAKAVAEQLSEIGKILKSYQTENDGVWVYPVPAHEKRDYLEHEAAKGQAARDHIDRELHRGHGRHQRALDTPPHGNKWPP
jgi:hypothetical protein